MFSHTYLQVYQPKVSALMPHASMLQTSPKTFKRPFVDRCLVQRARPHIEAHEVTRRAWDPMWGLDLLASHEGNLKRCPLGQKRPQINLPAFSKCGSAAEVGEDISFLGQGIGGTWGHQRAASLHAHPEHWGAPSARNSAELRPCASYCQNARTCAECLSHRQDSLLLCFESTEGLPTYQW